MALPLDDAIEAVLAACERLGAETVDSTEALGRVLADAVVAPLPIPPFPNSAMDGYAVRASDTARAPVTLPVSGDARAGLPLGETLAAGT